ncbi:MAG: energy-coupling factor transporter transmembrane component T [Tissierellia bacterium]|nr:energy-coupling factor transporter transmembrane component T [Tissierellia bacterium]
MLQYIMAVIGFIVLGFMDLRQFLKFFAIYLVMGLFIFFVLHSRLYSSIGVRFFYPLIVFLFKVWPLFTMARAIGTFTSSELMTAYSNIGLNYDYCIAIAIFFRFVPEFRHRMKEIREAVKIRNLGFNILHPVRSFEVFLVPLIYRGLSIADIITASIITKGIEYPCKKTSYRDIRFRYIDGIALVSVLVILGVAIWQKI